MSKIIMNSRGDIGLVRSMIVGFEVCGFYIKNDLLTNKLNYHYPALLKVNLVNDKIITFETSQTDEEMSILVERFKNLYEGDDDSVRECDINY